MSQPKSKKSLKLKKQLKNSLEGLYFLECSLRSTNKLEIHEAKIQNKYKELFLKIYSKVYVSEIHKISSRHIGYLLLKFVLITKRKSSGSERKF